MAYTYEQVMDILGDEAQAVPGAIVVFRTKHIDVAYTSLGNGFVVTPEGLEILAELDQSAQPEPSEKEVKPKRRSTKQADAVVESTNVLADDELNLSE